MKPDTGKLLICVIFFLLILTSMHVIDPVSAPEPPPGDEPFNNTENSIPINYQINLYDLGNGKFAQVSSLGFVNYYDGSEFVPINTTIISSLNPLYEYEVTKGIYQTYFKANPTEGQVIKFMIDSEYITYQPMALNYRNDLNQLQQIAMISSVQGTPNNNKFLYENAYGSGIDLQYSYWNDFLKEDLIINSLSDLIDPEQYIIDGGNPTLDLDFILTTNSDKIVIDGIEWDKSSTGETSNAVYIKDESGNVIYYLKKPYAYDSNGSLQSLTYQFRKTGNSLYVTVKTPYSWISNSSRVYPIYIDPDTGATSPGTMADDAAVGTITWGNPDRAKSSDDSSAVANMAWGEYAIRDVEVKIVKSDDSIGAENKADTGTNWPGTDTYKSYGSSSDLWSESWTAADINHANFGVVLSSKETTGNTQTHYLKATNFGFSVSGIVAGIIVEIERRNLYGAGKTFSYVDHFRITVHYTLPDTTPPSPSPLTWSSEPAVASSSQIDMTSTTASDDTGPISYQFDETTGHSGGTDRGWVAGDTTHSDTGLAENTQYGYKCQARDAVGTPNVGDWSIPISYEYTYANPPAGGQLDVDSFGDTWILWRLVDVDNNPDEGVTDGYFEIVTNPGGGSSGLSTDDDASYYYFNDTGLTAGQEYGMKARYDNYNGVDTTYCSEIKQTTLSANNAPTITGEHPTNGSTGEELGIAVGCTINDEDGGDTLTVTFATSPDGSSWTNRQTNGSISPGGTVNYTYTGASSYSTKYYWKVYADDGTDNTTSATWDFTTKTNTAPTSEVISPANGSTDIGLTPSCSIWANDTEDHTLTIKWYENSTDDDIGSDISIAGTATAIYSTSYPFQRKIFYANNLHWLFYSNNSYMVYQTSSDGLSWSAETTVRFCTRGTDFSIYYDGEYVQYAYYNQTGVGLNNDLKYRRGTISSSSINWESERTAVDASVNAAYADMVIIKNSTGYPWISYLKYESDTRYCYIVNASNTDGSTWNTPLQLSTIDNECFFTSVIALTDEKMYVIWGRINYPTYGKLFDGSWGNKENVTQSQSNSSLWSSLTASNTTSDIHFVYTEENTNDIIYRKRNVNNWEANQTIQTSQGVTSAAVMTIDKSNNNLHIFWFNNSILYHRKYNGITWEDIDTPFGSSFNTPNELSITAAYEVNNNTIGIAWHNDTKVIKYVSLEIAGWVLQQTNSSFASNNIASWIYIDASSYDTKYWWKVNISDGYGGYNESIYHFTTVHSLVFDINRTSFAFGTVQNNTIVYSNATEPDTFKIYNNGTCSIDIDVNGTNATAPGVSDWVLSPNNGDNLYKMGIYNTTTDWTQINLTTDTWYSNMAQSTNITANIRITTPTIFYSGKQMTCTVYMTASIH